MRSKIPMLLAALALCVQTVPAAAQTEGVEATTEEQARALGQDFLRSDLLLVLGAIAAAVLVNLALIAADGNGDDEPVSP